MSSLPSRERGLKSPTVGIVEVFTLSLPSRERGLKLRLHNPLRCHRPSPPSRERGLKCLGRGEDYLLTAVAPLAGAWIEMFDYSEIAPIIEVAPLAGAWIEISGIPSVNLSNGRSPRGSVD